MKNKKDLFIWICVACLLFYIIVGIFTVPALCAKETLSGSGHYQPNMYILSLVFTGIVCVILLYASKKASLVFILIAMFFSIISPIIDDSTNDLVIKPLFTLIFGSISPILLLSRILPFIVSFIVLFCGKNHLSPEVFDQKKSKLCLKREKFNNHISPPLIHSQTDDRDCIPLQELSKKQKTFFGFFKNKYKVIILFLCAACVVFACFSFVTHSALSNSQQVISELQEEAALLRNRNVDLANSVRLYNELKQQYDKLRTNYDSLISRSGGVYSAIQELRSLQTELLSYDRNDYVIISRWLSNIINQLESR